VTAEVAAGFAWRDSPLGPVLASEVLAPMAEHLFTARGGRFRDEAVEPDYARLGQALGIRPDRIGRVRQVHGREVILVRPGDPVPHGVDADALISTDPTCAVSVRVADCVPMLIADRQRRLVAAVHAGWRGTCAGIAMRTVVRIAEAGVPPDELVAVIGPAIGRCCYQVDERVRSAFLAMTPDAAAWFDEDGPGRWKLDLWQANADQLVASGVVPGAIHTAGLCTADQPDVCYSYRREGPATGRMVAAARLRT